MPLPARAASRICVLLVELITELVSVLAAQKRRSTQTQSTIPLPSLSMGSPSASPAVHDWFLDFAPPVFVVGLYFASITFISAVLFISCFSRSVLRFSLY